MSITAAYTFAVSAQQHWHQSTQLSLGAGQHVGIIGASGAGKTTLVQQIYRQLRQQHSKHIDQHAALIPQQLGLVENLSSYHNVYAGVLSRHPWWYNLVNLLRPFKTPYQQITQLLIELGLDNKNKQVTGSLSGGEQQRIAIARALFQQAPLLLADEPLNGLDQQRQQQVLALLLTTFESGIWVLHDLALAQQHFQRLWIVNKGQISHDVSSSELSLEQLQQLCAND